MEVGARVDAAQPIRRDGGDVEAEPGQHGAQIVRRHVDGTGEGRAVDTVGDPPGERHVRPAGKQGGGAADRDRARVEGQDRPRLAHHVAPVRHGFDREVQRRREAGGERAEQGGHVRRGGRGIGRFRRHRRARRKAVEIEPVQRHLEREGRCRAAAPGYRAGRLALAQPDLDVVRGDRIGACGDCGPRRERALRQRRQGHAFERDREGGQESAWGGHRGPHGAVEPGRAVEPAYRPFQQRTAGAVGEGQLRRRRHRAVRADRPRRQLKVEGGTPCRERPFAPERPVERPRGEDRVDPFDPRGRPLARRPIDDRAVRHGDRIEPDRPLVRGAHGACRALEEPVGASVGQALQLDDGGDQCEAGDGDLTAEQRPQRQREVDGLDPRHVGGARARKVGQAQIREGERRRGQEGDRDLPVDPEPAPGGGFHPLRDLRLEALPVEERRHEEEGGDEERQHRQDAVEDLHRAARLGAGRPCTALGRPRLTARFISARLVRRSTGLDRVETLSP